MFDHLSVINEFLFRSTSVVLGQMCIVQYSTALSNIISV